MSNCTLFCSWITKKIFIKSILSKMPFYAVANGRTQGVFQSWGECERQVKGFKGARYKKFDTHEEAANFAAGNCGSEFTSFARSYSSASSNRPLSSAGRSNQTNTGNQPTDNQKKYTSALQKSSKSSVVTVSSDDSDFESMDDIHDALMRKMDQLENDIGQIKQNVMKNNRKPNRTMMIDPLPNVSTSLKRPTDQIGLTDSKRFKKIDLTKDNNSYEFQVDDSGYVEVYTDGACSRNGSKSAQAGLGVYFGEQHPLNVSEPVSGRATNNCGEIQAATKAIRIVHSLGVKKVAIKTDSQFVINSVTKWMKGWKRKGWKLASGEPVKNEIDFKDLDDAIKLVDVKWEYVNAHKGIHGNERADQLAKDGASRYKR